MLRAARKAVDRRDETAPAVDVLAEINRIQTSGAITTRERKAAKRDSVNTPVVPVPDVDSDPTDNSIEFEAGASVRAPREHKAARRIDQDEEE